MTDWTHCTVEDAKRMRDELDMLSDGQQEELDDALQKYGWPVMWCSTHVVFWLHGEAVRRGWLEGL